MLQWIKNLFFQKEKYKNEILFCIATIEDLDFLEDCIQAGSSEKHFREMSRDEIKKAIKHQTQNSILAVIKSAETNIDIGFLYVGKNNRIFESGTQEVFSGYEINLLYILEPYRKNGIGTKTILQIEKMFKQQNVNKIYARCDKYHSIEAIALFKKLGYQDNGKVSEFPNKDLYYIILEKDLV